MKSSSVTSLSGGAVAASVVSLLVLLVIWHVSTPISSGPLGILLVFTLIYIFFTSVLLIITGAGTILARRFGRTGLNDRRRYYISSVLGFLPVLYLTLLSMGGASIWGILLIALFIGLMLFYVLRRSA